MSKETVMAEQAPVTRPELGWDPSADEPAIEVLSNFRDNLYQDPHKYAAILSKVAELKGSWEAQAEPIDGDALSCLNRVFKFRFDKEIVFDNDTETAISQHEDIRGLKKGIESRSGSTQEVSRDELRRLRLQCFISRLISWQNQNAEAVPTPSQSTDSLLSNS